MGKVIIVTSGKGGVGKTTVSALLGHALQKKAYSVLLIDGDMGLRDLDLALGVQDEVIFTSRDLWKKECFREDALITIENSLEFLAASQKYRWEDIKSKKFLQLIKKMKKHYDFIIVDAPAGVGLGVEHLLDRADKALLLMEPTWMSLRDAQKVMELMRNKRFHDYGVVINKIPEEEENLISVSDICHTLSIENLAALLPYDKDIRKHCNEGTLQLLQKPGFLKMMAHLVSFLDDSVDENYMDRSSDNEENQWKVEEESWGLEACDKKVLALYEDYVNEKKLSSSKEGSFKQKDRRLQNRWKWSKRRR